MLILDPTDKIFHLKTPLFVLIVLVWLLSKGKIKIRYNIDSLTMIYGLLLISMFGIIAAHFQNYIIDYEFSAGFVKSLSILFLLIVIIDLDIEIDTYLNRFTILIPFIIIPVYFFSFYNPHFFGITYDYLVTEKEVAMFSLRNFYGYEVIMIYYKTSPLLVFPLSFFCSKLKSTKNFTLTFILITILFIALIMSGTRANIISAFVVVVYYAYLYIRSKRNAIISIIGTLSFIFASVLFFFSLSFDSQEESSEVKSGHFTSFITNFENNPEFLIWGQGLGSVYYSTGSSAFKAQTELTYFDLVRYFGIPLAILFLLFIVYPFIFLIKNKMINDRNRYIVISFITYLFIAGTNPLLISSTGMLILIVMYSFINTRIYPIMIEKKK